MDVSRYVFNWTIDFINSCQNWSPNWMEIKKCATYWLPDWTKNCPFQIKAIAIKDATAAFYKAKGKPKFRNRKHLQQSCFIPKTAIKEHGIYPRISGKDLEFTESLPESYLDSRLIWIAGKYYLAMLSKSPRVLYGETQARVVAIDPGIRTFIAFYSDDACGLIGKSDFSRIQRLAHYLDVLISKMSKVRSMLSFAHYRFKQFIKHKAYEYGKRVVDVNEAYTSKTHPETGEIKNIGGAKQIRLLSGEWVNRDLVGARNILLRALVDTPQSADWQLIVA